MAATSDYICCSHVDDTIRQPFTMKIMYGNLIGKIIGIIMLRTLYY